MNKQAAPDFRMIATAAQLDEAAAALLAEKKVSVDLEADSMYHFKEKVCLLQLAAGSTRSLVDPLAVADLSALKPVFADPAIRKIFHGADYDIRCLYRDFGITVENLFDTQLACRFLGVRETGLEAVLLKRFNVAIDKRYQKKDWSQRPLPQEMRDYAARDVLYLLPLARILERELKQRDRLFWVKEENELLSRVRPNSDRLYPLYLNFKGAGRLSPRDLAILEGLLNFRRTIAAKKDRPLFKVLGNATLLSIVKVRPQTVPELEKVRPLGSKQTGMYGEALIETLRAALALPAEELPHYPHRHAPTIKPAARRKIKVLKDWREAKGARLELDPALVCSKAVMGDLAGTNPRTLSDLEDIKEMRNWQKKVFGEELVSVLKRAGR